MTFYHRRKPWHHKPIRNTLKIPMPTNTARKVRSALLPRVQQLVKGGIVPKPLWLDAALAHPPPVAHKYRWGKPVKFEWRDEDRLRRIWQRRTAAPVAPDTTLSAAAALQVPQGWISATRTGATTCMHASRMVRSHGSRPVQGKCRGGLVRGLGRALTLVR